MINNTPCYRALKVASVFEKQATTNSMWYRGKGVGGYLDPRNLSEDNVNMDNYKRVAAITGGTGGVGWLGGRMAGGDITKYRLARGYQDAMTGKNISSMPNYQTNAAEFDDAARDIARERERMGNSFLGRRKLRRVDGKLSFMEDVARGGAKGINAPTYQAMLDLAARAPTSALKRSFRLRAKSIAEGNKVFNKSTISSARKVFGRRAGIAGIGLGLTGSYLLQKRKPKQPRMLQDFSGWLNR